MEEMKLYDINSIEFNELMDSARMQLKDSNSEYKELRKKGLTIQIFSFRECFHNLSLLFSFYKTVLF